MPRDGSNIYSQPFPDVVEDTTIESTVYNGFTNDIAADLNAARPIVAGGTGATNADQALFNLAAEKAAQVVTNYDSHLWVPGSFRSATTATGMPVASHAFAGVCYINEALANPPTNQNVIVEATDTTDAASTTKYIRIKTSGVWGSWTGVSSGSAATSVGEYTTDSGITFPPGSGQIRLNNATQNSATEIFISHLTVTGTDNTNLIPFVIKVGSDIAIQDKDEIAKYKIFTATADPVLSGGDYRVTVTFKSGGTDLGLAQRVMVGATGGGTVSYTTAQTLTETQEAQARSNVYAAPFDALMYNGMQLNGNGEIDQQNAGSAVQVTVSGGNMRPADGWSVIVTQASGAVNIGAHQTTSSGLPGHPLMVRTVAQNANFLAGTNGDALYLRHVFEGYRVSRLGWGTAGAVPLSYAMRVYSVVSGTLAIRFFNGAINRFYYVEHAVVGATWSWITGTIPADTSGTWLVTNGVGLYMDIIFGGKEASPAVPNTWVGGSVKAQTTSSTNLMGALNNAVSVTGFIAVPGTELPSVDRIAYIMRPGDVELPMCQRHYWKDSAPSWMFAENVSAGVGANTVCLPVRFPQTMRATPIVTLPTLTLGGCGTPQLTSAPPNQYGTTIAASSTGAAGSRMYMLYASGSLTADARL